MLVLVQVLDRRCVACGLCVRVAPRVFSVADHRVARPVDNILIGEDAEATLAAAEACPVEAIAATLAEEWVYVAGVRR